MPKGKYTPNPTLHTLEQAMTNRYVNYEAWKKGPKAKGSFGRVPDQYLTDEGHTVLEQLRSMIGKKPRRLYATKENLDLRYELPYLDCFTDEKGGVGEEDTSKNSRLHRKLLVAHDWLLDHGHHVELIDHGADESCSAYVSLKLYTNPPTHMEEYEKIMQSFGWVRKRQGESGPGDNSQHWEPTEEKSNTWLNISPIGMWAYWRYEQGMFDPIWSGYTPATLLKRMNTLDPNW